MMCKLRCRPLRTWQQLRLMRRTLKKNKKMRSLRRSRESPEWSLDLGRHEDVA